jgi:hypothetical protein
MNCWGISINTEFFYKILCNDGVPAQFSKLIFPLGVITVYELKMFTTEPIMSADSQCLSTWIKEE